MGKYNRKLFKVITIAVDVHRTLTALKRSSRESFTDVIRRLAKAAKRQDIAFSFVRPVNPQVEAFYRSGLFE